jgi:CrcB protein
MINYLWVALGSGLGGLCRYGVGLIAEAWLGGAFPWGTIFINVVGSLVIGGFIGMTAPDGRWLASAHLRIFVTTGFCGGFTTFSSFSLQTIDLLQRGDRPAALANIGLSVVLCLAATWLGHAGARALARPPTGRRV